MLKILAIFLDISITLADAIVKRLDEIAREKQKEQKEKDSQVIAYANALLDESRRYKDIAAVAVLIASGNFELTGDLKLLDTVIIGESGYAVYIVNQGKIVNNGARGFTNWTVVGNSTQHDNVITVP
jgi:predicted transcriptional regulator